MWQSHLAPAASTHPWGWVSAQQEQLQELHLKELLVKAQTRGATNFSLSLRNSDARRAGSKANCPHPLKPRPPLQEEQRVWGGVVKHLLTIQMPSRTTKSKWDSSWISQGTKPAFRDSQLGLHFSQFLRHQ